MSYIIDICYTFKNTNYIVRVARPGDCIHCQLKTLAVNSITCSSPRDFKCRKCKIYNVNISLTKVWQDLWTKLSYSDNTFSTFKTKIWFSISDVAKKPKTTNLKYQYGRLSFITSSYLFPHCRTQGSNLQWSMWTVRTQLDTTSLSTPGSLNITK